MSDFDVAVVGAGAVGLACAVEFCKRGLTVVVIERESSAFSGTSSRNSQVIHSGLYYTTGSLKHTLCVRGRELWYDYLRRFGARYRKCGKLIVATSVEQLTKLDQLHTLSVANSVGGVMRLSSTEVQRLEPEIRAQGALLCSETGVMSVLDAMNSLLHDISERGGTVAFRTEAVGARCLDSGFLVELGGLNPTAIKVSYLINSAGLFSHGFAGSIDGYDHALIPQQYLAVGRYFRFTRQSPFSHLVYPVPVDGGLGIHGTLDVDGTLRFGPDVMWLDVDVDPHRISYDVDLALRPIFCAAIREYWPNLPDSALAPDYCGCRPKLSGKGSHPVDFQIELPSSNGVRGLVNLYGIESPGLTSSLAIGEFVAEALVGS